MTSQEMMKTECGAGNMFRNQSAVDQSPDWIIAPKTADELAGLGNPNHPAYRNKLFGYDAAEFMARQYK